MNWINMVAKQKHTSKGENKSTKENIQKSKLRIGIPRSVPKIDHKLKVDIVEFLQTFIQARGLKSCDHDTFILCDTLKLQLKLDSIIKHLFPDKQLDNFFLCDELKLRPQLYSKTIINHLFPVQELELRNRIWSSLIRAQCVIIIGIPTLFLPFFDKNAFSKINRHFSDQCTDIHFLQKYDFEDKHFIMGRLFIAKALAQHLQIRCARTQMCEIAELTRIQKFKLRQTLQNTINAIKWWLTPKAEEAFLESLRAAALYLEPTLLTADHALLLLFFVKDCRIVYHYILRMLQFLQSTRSPAEVELIKQFYIDMCCGINLSYVKGVISFTFYKDIQNTFAPMTLNNEKAIRSICKLGVLYINGFCPPSVIPNVYTTLLVEGKQTRMSHSLQLILWACRFRNELLRMPRCASNSLLIDSCYPKHQKDHYSIKCMCEHFKTKLLSSFDPDTNICDWAFFIENKNRLLNERDQFVKDIRLKYYQPFTLAQEDDTISSNVSQSNSLDNTLDEEQPTKRKKVLSKRRNPKNISRKDYASDSDGGKDDSRKDNCEGPPVDTNSEFCVYFRHQVPAFSLDKPEDLLKVSLDDMEVLKHENICPEQTSNPLLECEPRPSQVYTTDTDSGSDIADLWEDKHNLLFVDREEDIL